MWFPCFESLVYNEIQRSCGDFWQSNLYWDNKDIKNASAKLTVLFLLYRYKGVPAYLFESFIFFILISFS